MKRKFGIVILVMAIVALWVTPAFAAQGQITEVNPSGIVTTDRASGDNQADPAAQNPDGDYGAAGGAIISGGQVPNGGLQNNTGAGGTTGSSE